ncbi:hypothetical protein KJ656_11185 [bacterium]|nr:hypothetical protein [bacterium]
MRRGREEQPAPILRGPYRGVLNPAKGGGCDLRLPERCSQAGLPDLTQVRRARGKTLRHRGKNN